MIELLPAWKGEFYRWLVLCNNCPSQYFERANCTAYYEGGNTMNTAELAEHWRAQAERFDRAGNRPEARHAWACYMQLLRERIAELQSTDDPEDERRATQIREQLAFYEAENH